MSISQVPFSPPIQIDRRDQILERSLLVEARRQRRRVAARSQLSGEGKRLDYQTRSDDFVPIREFTNQKGQKIKAIIDSWGDPDKAIAVIIPPAWGRTKETLLPLALTILETFRRANQPVTVIRFDGTNRRGEAFIDSTCRYPGDEYLHFTFSQAVSDIEATIDFLHSDSIGAPKATVLVTFSLASIEGRRVLARDRGKRIRGWISAVGMTDLQSGLRAISGGVDYGYGLLRGIRFGRNELLGVVADMDHTGIDALNHEMGLFEDARRDMASISVPVTWIHGRHDAWMSIDRVAELMSCGTAKGRKLIEVPTGHQLRVSREALQTFQLIAEEIGEMVAGRAVMSVLPSLESVERRADCERRRLPAAPTNIRAFWADYLLGRDRRIGMGLLTETAHYQSFLEQQVSELGLDNGSRVADLGCGIGEFTCHLQRFHADLNRIQVHLVDYIPEVLKHATTRARNACGESGPVTLSVASNLDPREAQCFALASGAYDAVIASLLITYLFNPKGFLGEAFRILKPGGRFVLSGLKKDADVSKLYADGMAELDRHTAERRFGSEIAKRLDFYARGFLNEAARLLQIEEAGLFQFFDAGALCNAVEEAGFTDVRATSGLGDPAQAIIVSARRPRG
jgi:ubiquinone/menaquinone biosynthesis C-methylase UbiE/pimeloyl-ACP methyl ester carboxylesterase